MFVWVRVNRNLILLIVQIVELPYFNGCHCNISITSNESTDTRTHSHRHTQKNPNENTFEVGCFFSVITTNVTLIDLSNDKLILYRYDAVAAAAIRAKYFRKHTSKQTQKRFLFRYNFYVYHTLHGGLCCQLF